MRKVFYFALVFLLGITAGVNAQVTIGADADPHAGAVLDLRSNNRGLLLPKVSLTDVAVYGLNNPSSTQASADGMMVYNTNPNIIGGSGVGIYIWDGEKWAAAAIKGGKMKLSVDPSTFDKDGGKQDVEIVNTACNLPGNYTYMVIVGQDYATLDAESSSDGRFALTFEANPTAMERKAIVMVTDPCGETATFVFTQDFDAALCGPTVTVPSIASYSGNTLCSGGAAYLYLNGSIGSNDANDYIWTLGNVEVGRGKSYAATATGKYIVYYKAVGCSNKSAEFSLTPSGSTAPGAVRIIVNGNNGYVCDGSGMTTIIAQTAGAGTIRWYKDGELQASLNGAQITAGVGTWTAVVQDGGCWSKPSDEAVVQVDPNAGASITPPVVEASGSYCEGSSVQLSVSDASYNAAYTYTWYENNTQIGTGRSTIYTVPTGTESIVIRCRATQPGSCAAEAIAVEPITTGSIPARPAITGNAVLCSGVAELNVVPVGGGTYTYAWYKDGQLMATTPSITVNSGGDYYASVTASGGCTSPLAHRNIPAATSATPTVTLNKSSESPNLNDVVTYAASIDFTPATNYNWTITNGTLQSGGGNTPNAVVRFAATGAASVKVEVSNACGTGMATHSMNIASACADPTSVSSSDNLVKNTVTGQSVTLGSVSATFSSGTPTAKFQWYRNTINSTTGGASISGATNNTYVATESNAGTYYYYCVVSNAGCPSSEMASGVYAVTVTSNPGEMVLGSGTFSGKTCFDINKSNSNADCGTQASRTSTAVNFATLGAVTYTFTASASGTKSNLRFVVVDNESCVASYSGGKSGTIANNETVNLTVNYKTNLSDDNGGIKGRTRSDAAKVVIYAVYNDGSKDVSIPLTVSIQDCVCCGAFTASGVWKTFMCHNLGANEGYDPFTPNKEIHGAKYRFGAKAASYTQAQDQSNSGAISGWGTGSTASFPLQASGDWTAANNPCPAGWRLPTITEWQGVINTSLNAQTAVGTWTNSATNYSSGRKFGNALFLPAAGYRRNSDGTLGNRGYSGYYWSSTQSSSDGQFMRFNSGTTDTHTTDRSFGFSVRCVAE